MSVHILQHAPFEGPGRIRSWALSRGLRVTATRLFRGEPLPDAPRRGCLVSLGGPMGVGDSSRHPWLGREARFIEQALARGVKVLGVCLGAQLLAHVLGAKVRRNRMPEIGWFPIALTDAGLGSPLAGLGRERTVFHWHSDTFDLPGGAERLASSAACEQQAFSYGGSAWGLQFHLELDRAGVSALIRNGLAEAGKGPFVQDRGSMLRLAATLPAVLHPALDAVLDRWILGRTPRQGRARVWYHGLHQW